MRDAENTGKTITREQLYKLAWLMPLEILAQKLSISSRRLIKILDKLQVPYPRPSYWKRKQAGKIVLQRGLPNPLSDTPAHVVIKRQEERKNLTQELRNWHPVIAKWRDEMKSMIATHPSLAGAWHESELRKHAILNRIFVGVERHGIRPLERRERDTVRFTYESVELACTLREKRRRVAVKKPGEKATFHNFELTGDFTFKIESYVAPTDRFRRKWEENAKTRLEKMIPDIVIALSQAGQKHLRWKQQEHEATPKRLEERQRAEEAELRQRREQRRWRAFVGYAERLNTIDKLRILIDHLERETASPSTVIADRQISEWLQWAKDRLEAFNPLRIGVAELFSEIAKTTNWDDASLR